LFWEIFGLTWQPYFIQKTVKAAMRRISLFLIMGLIIAGMSACGTDSEPNEVTQLEAQLQAAYDAETLDPAQIRALSGKLGNALLVRADAHPEADQTPEDLFRAAELYEQDINQIEQALTVYARLIEAHPQHERAADALFKQGYIYHNVLQDLPKAETAYRSFLQQYPTHNLAPSAQEELNFLGVSPEEWLRTKMKSRPDSTKGDSAL
jgi:tetratricopeptide (TPR) repeat protein